MLNLIKNEYAKIFHKKSSYILLIILLLSIIGLPLFNKYINNNDSYFYYTTYDDEIRWAEDTDDTVYAEKLKKAKNLEIPVEKFFSDKPGWKIVALDDLYYSYWYKFNLSDEELAEDYGATVSAEEKTEAETMFNEGIKYVENNDWKGYYNFKIKLIESNPDYTAAEKEYFTYSYKYMIENDIEPGTDNWQEDALKTYSDNVQTYEELKALKDAGETYDEKSFAAAERLTLISKYRLENNISSAIYEAGENELYSPTEIYIYTGEMVNNMKNSVSLLIIVLLMILIIAGNIISKEFSQGTIKFLLINPVKRSKIFWSKYITVFSYAFLLTIATYVLEYIMSLLVFGTSELSAHLLLVEAGEIVAHSAALFILFRYMLAFVTIMIAFTIAFMISSLFRNSALAITLSMIVYFIGSTACDLASYFNLDFFRYTIFATQDLTTIINGKSLFIHMTAGFAVTVIVVHIILMLFTAHDAFTKRNV